MQRVNHHDIHAQITTLKERHRRTEQTIARVQRYAPDNPVFEHTSRDELVASMHSSQRRDHEHILILEAELNALYTEQVRYVG